MRGRTDCASISATLWRSETWDGKFSSVSAAVSDDRTQARYGLSVFDCVGPGSASSSLAVAQAG